MKLIKIIFYTVALLMTAACVSTDLPVLPETDVPQQWAGPFTEEDIRWPDLDWWRSFESDELVQIMDTIEVANLDLANNARNVEKARIGLKDAGFDLYPTPILDVGLSGRYAGSDTRATSYSSNRNTDFSLGGGLAYTDILSKPARYETEVARYDSDIARFADIRLNTLGLAASTYFQVLLIRDRIQAAEQNLTNAEAIARIVQARVDAGTVTPVDALQQTIEVQRQRNNVRRLIQDELAAISSLATLQARSVADVQITTQTLDQILVPEIAPGLPSSLLSRRPDIAVAEADLRLFRANVNIAKLAFFPTVSLTADAGIVNGSFTGLFDGHNLGVSALGNVLQTLLDNGARKRSLKLTEIDLESALASYRKTVIAAFNEIEVSLSNLELLESLGRVAAEDLARAEEAYRIASVRYREGVAQYQTVLTTQNTLFTVRNTYLDSKLARLNAVVAFYQSLGGGWEQQRVTR